MKLLIVDDIKEQRYMLETLLRGHGYEVTSAADGVEALEKASQEGYDMIISDVLMPRMDGFQLCRKVKQNKNLKKIAFVFYTATYTDPKDEEFALSLGAERFIVKPTEPDVFVGILKEVIESHERGILRAPKRPVGRETVYLKEYSERLIRKLESKVLELERVNKELRESEDKYRDLLDNANDAVIAVSEKGYLGFANPKFLEMTGYSLDEAKKLHLKEIIHPHDLERVTEYFERRLARNEVPRNYELRLLTKAGKTIHIDNSVNAIEKEGRFIGILAIMRDITERKRADEEIRMLAHTVKSINDCVNICDMDNNILFVNKAFCDVYGYKEEEILGESTTVLLSSAVPEELVSKVLSETLKGGWYGELFNKRKDGSEFPVYLSTSVIRDENGESLALVGVSRDITEQKRAQEEREKLHAQLVQAQKMEAMGRLAGGVAHDFNNLLTVIRGYTELTMARLNGEDAMQCDLAEVQQASTRGASLTRQLLLFSRKQPMDMTPLNPNKTVEDMMKMISRLIGEDISITTDLEKDPWTIKADPGSLEQVVMNLVVNARDAMPEGGTITIRTKNVQIDEHYSKLVGSARTGNFVCLSIADSGIGMDGTTVERIFEPFFSTKGPEKGTGLGLSVVYGIIKQHEGWINVYSELGQGSMFTVYLPAVPAKPQVVDEQQCSLVRFQGKGERILLVEDEQSVLDLNTRTLQEYGYVPFPSNNVRQALEVFQRENGDFALVFSDLVLPDGNGLSLIEQLFSLKRGVRALLSSGYSDKEALWQAIRQKRVRFLQKPYSLSDLLQTIREELESERKMEP